jgi:hypothetical protein
MKKNLLTIVVLLFVFKTATAQEDTVAIRYTRVFAGGVNIFYPSLKFEKAIRPKWSLGLQVKSALPIYVFGLRAEFIARRYFKTSAPYGLFIQMKANCGLYDQWMYAILGNIPHSLYWAPGLGFALGHQFHIGKNDRVALDLYGGLQFSMPLPYYPEEDLLKLIVHWVMVSPPLEIGLRFGRFF